MTVGATLAGLLRPAWPLQVGRWLVLLGILCLDFVTTRRFRTLPADGGVMIVRLDAIGDFIMWQRSARHYRTLFPESRLVLAANAAWADLAARLPYWDEVIAINVPELRSDLRYRRQLLTSLSRRRFSVALHPTHSRSLMYGDSVVRATRAAVCIGSAGDLTNISASQKRLADRWYTVLVPAKSEPMAEVDRHLHFLRALGWEGSAAAVDALAVERLPTVANLVTPFAIDQPYCVVFPGAGSTGRQWSPDAFASLIEAMAKEFPGRLIVLCGGPSERELCAKVSALSRAVTVNMAGVTTLPEFCELVRRADLLIGNETSAVHIAAAVGTPSVCVVGGGHFGRFVPYPARPGVAAMATVYVRMPCFGCNWRCHLPHAEDGPVPCISAITVDSVLAAVRQIAPHRAAAPAVDLMRCSAITKGP